MKKIHVAAAVITDGTSVLATRRNYGDFAGGYEFPGGKLEAGESGEEALHREIREELKAKIVIDRLLGTVEYDYPKFHLTMDCYLCRLMGHHITLTVHDRAKWLHPDEFDTVNWLPADVKAVGWAKEALRA
ncbi:(deoxy)nucleoside triphosphate pyrophosphohydrolase [Mitsuokella sp.]|uniref:(deoxy)nucleoside triphosphate pyrophosphohydrolase n=1 Tax=unclassified Mitsuokella TaxID=2637239 RepID=UPI003D7D9A59